MHIAKSIVFSVFNRVNEKRIGDRIYRTKVCETIAESVLYHVQCGIKMIVFCLGVNIKLALSKNFLTSLF